MHYRSTRFGSPDVDFRTVLLQGLAPDGGLYVPDEIPGLPTGWRRFDYLDAVTWSLGAFGASDPEPMVSGAVARYRHPEVAPLIEVGDRLVYELFWGPTLSFKDHALQILGRLLEREVAESGPRLVLGATSGDTGSAAIAGCKGSPHLRVMTLFPEGMVSEFQRRQMTTVLDENVTVVAVRGSFDDCQALVKQAFANHRDLLAFNSINWARVAAQIGYYVYLATRVTDQFDVVVPTGNFGNVYSCWMAKQMGAPIETITLANNANHLLADIASGIPVEETAVVPTIAPAMDVRIPSNWERFTADPVVEFSAGWATDSEIMRTMREVHADHGYLLDPHTAAAWHAGRATQGDRRQVVVATAHPAKFAEVVENAVGISPDTPPGYESLMDMEERFITIDADSSALDALIR